MLPSGEDLQRLNRKNLFGISGAALKYAAPYLYILEYNVRKKQLRIYRFVISMLVLFAISLSACTIRKIDENNGEDGDIYSTWNKTGTGFNAEKYVDANWDSKIIPAFHNDSVEVSELIKSLETNLDGAVVKYGYRKDENSEEIFFKVKGQGHVLTFNDSSRNGLLEIDLKPVDGNVDIFIQVGPVIKRTEIRDSLSFIKFTDVGNQLQFASLSDELTKRVLTWTLKDINFSEIAGKVIEFNGVFSVKSENINIDKIIITPVVMKYIN